MLGGDRFLGRERKAEMQERGLVEVARMDTGCGICRRRDAWDSPCDARERVLRVSRPVREKRSYDEVRLFLGVQLLHVEVSMLPRQIVDRTANTAR